MASNEGEEVNTAKTENAASLSPPLRQDRVQNAVAFLKHPKVYDSSDESKRSFLERKGLTKAEIDVAFENVKKGAGGHPGFGDPPQAPPPVSQTIRAYSWSKTFMGVTVIAAGILAFQKYAVPWVREWTRRRVTATEDAQRNGHLNSETHQELKRYCGSMERSMQEMTMEIRTLCSKIDMLALESRRDSQQADIQEIKLLLNGLAEAPSASMSQGMNPLWTPGASPQSGRPITPNIGQVSFGDEVSAPQGHDVDHQAEYMNVLGLLANGKHNPQQQMEQHTERSGESPANAPPNSWGVSASNGGLSLASAGEIRPASDSGMMEHISGPREGSVLQSSGFGSKSWAPPALPEATIKIAPEKELDIT